MGQFDIITYELQITYFVLISLFSYYFFVKYILSVLYVSLRTRVYIENLISNDINNLTFVVENTKFKIFSFYENITKTVDELNSMLIVWNELNVFFGTITEVEVSVVYDLFDFFAEFFVNVNVNMEGEIENFILNDEKVLFFIFVIQYFLCDTNFNKQ